MAIRDLTATVDSDRFWRAAFIVGLVVVAVGLALLVTITSLAIAAGVY
ncbi:hypothetical protein [Haloarcula laminariae]|nr:hypothetical protein [Halomicroarcula sp. FL173]